MPEKWELNHKEKEQILENHWRHDYSKKAMDRTLNATTQAAVAKYQSYLQQGDRRERIAEIYCQNCRQANCDDRCNCDTCYDVADQIISLFPVAPEKLRGAIESEEQSFLSNAKEHLRQYQKDGDLEYHAERITEKFKVVSERLLAPQIEEARKEERERNDKFLTTLAEADNQQLFKVTITRKEFLALPIETRRRLLKQRVDKLDEAALQDKGMMD